MNARGIHLRWMVRALLATAAATALLGAGAARADGSSLPRSFAPLRQEPGGGSVWQGRVPGSRAFWPTLVYLPPGVSADVRYPLVEVLHGLAGSPYSIVNGLRLARTADALIDAHVLPPFVAVIPSAGARPLYRGEWTGRWEREVVATERWASRTLPVLRTARGHVLAGLSAGGYGAIDIGLRHPRLFGTLEAWSGYFHAPHDGSLAHADAAERAANDPTRLAAREATLLRRLGTRFFLSCGSTRDRATTALARAFARELDRLRLPHALRLAPGGHDGAFWRAQLPTALAYALASI